MKKIIKLLLCITLVVSLSGCGSKKGSEEFSTFTKALPAKILKQSSMDINFLFDKPENYGIKKKVYGLDFTSLSDYKAYVKDMETIVDELGEYDYDALNKDQKITYDLLQSLVDNEDETPIENSYYLTTNYFDVSSGVQANLPLSLWNYEFKNQKSLDSFLAILKESPTYFKKYTDLEATRQKKGYGLSKVYMDDVIKNLHTIATTDQTYILDATFEKIEQATFITDEKKQSYKDEITTYFNDSFLPAFAQAEKDLSSIKIEKKGDGELASYKYGKDYYEQYICDELGFDSIKEYSEYLDSTEKAVSNRVITLLRDYPELLTLMDDMDALQNRMETMNLTSLTNANDVIQSLEQTVNTGKDFPAIQKLEYTMHEIPASMKETTTAVAAYFISAFDDTSGKDENMMFNGTFSQSDYTTLAHESFPGHMYQNNYFKTVKHDILRDILSASAYSEGWATYVEQKSCDYSDDPAMCNFSNINNQLAYLMVLKLDKKIHYDGITREEAYAYMRENLSDELSDEDLSKQYEQLLQNPGVFSKYYGGLYRILDLKDKAVKKWDDKYSDYRFNKAVLDLGALPMDLLGKYLKLS